MVKYLFLCHRRGIGDALIEFGFPRDEIIAVLVNVFKVVFHLVVDAVVSYPSCRIDYRFRNRKCVAEAVGHPSVALKPTEEGIAVVCFGCDCHLGFVSIFFTNRRVFGVG